MLPGRSWYLLVVVDKEIELKICEPTENKLLSRESPAEKSCFVGSVSSRREPARSSDREDTELARSSDANCQLQNSSDNFPREGVKL